MNYLTYAVMAVLRCFIERKPDVLIATSGHIFCGLSGAIVGRLLGVPFVLEIRDIWPESIVAVGALQSGRAVRTMELIERYIYRRAYHIVTVGAGYKQGLMARGVDEARISIVMNGVDADLFVPEIARDRDSNEYGTKDRFVVTYCGAIGLAHGLEVVLRAAELLRGRGRDRIMFLLVGDGARLAPLRAEALRRGVDNVRFVGTVDRARVPSILAVSDVSLVHLRKSSTFEMVMPSKIFEAGAMGLPIILGVEGFARDFVERAGCGLCVEPENELQLVEAIERLSDDRVLRNRMGAAGRRYVTERFDRNALADRYARIMENLVRTRGI